MICIIDTTSPTPCFFWHRIAYNLYYRIKISTDSLFLNTVYNSGFTPDTFKCMSVPSLNYGYCYYLNFLAQDITGLTYFWGNYRFHLTQMIGINPFQNNAPLNYTLYQNFPNPFNPVTKIKFSIPSPSPSKMERGSWGEVMVSLLIYDLPGREVATLVNEKLSPGTYEIEWDASNFASGIYFYKLIAGDFVDTKKMVLMK